MSFCYAEAAVNSLANPALDPYVMFPELKFYAAQVTPVATVVETVVSARLTHGMSVYRPPVRKGVRNHPANPL